MFSITVKYGNRVERLLASQVIEWQPGEGVTGVLALDDEDVELGPDDVAFVTNQSGQTVRIYGKRR